MSMGSRRSVSLVQPFEQNFNVIITGPPELRKYEALTINDEIFGPTTVKW